MMGRREEGKRFCMSMLQTSVNVTNIHKVDRDSNTELLYSGFSTRVNIFHLLLKREEFGDILKYWVQREII